MNDIVDIGPNSVSRALSEGGRFHVHTRFFDDAALAQNRRIADSGMLDKGKLGLHDDEDIRFVISCPSTRQWALFKKDNPEIYKLITTRGTDAIADADRMKGARKLSILHPAWVVYSRL